MIIKGHNEIFEHIFKELDAVGYEEDPTWFLLIKDRLNINYGGYQQVPLVLLDNHILACPNFKFNKKDYSLEMGPILWRIESMYQGKSIPYITIKLRPIFYEYGVFEMTEIEIKNHQSEPNITRILSC